MNFRKVSDHELRCSVTIDEIHENGLEVSDLLKKTEKTYSFFEYLVQEAEEETGFEKSGPMSVEGIFVNGILELIFRVVDEAEGSMLPEMEEDMGTKVDDGEPGSSLPPMDENVLMKLVQVSFTSIERLTKFCRLLSFASKIPSSLYQIKNKYILILDLDDCNREEIGAFCLLVQEYGQGSLYGDLQASNVMEHGKLLLDDACYRLHQM